MNLSSFISSQLFWRISAYLPSRCAIAIIQQGNISNHGFEQASHHGTSFSSPRSFDERREPQSGQYLKRMGSVLSIFQIAGATFVAFPKNPKIAIAGAMAISVHRFIYELFLIKFQLSRHICSSPRCAFQPSFFFASAGFE